MDSQASLFLYRRQCSFCYKAIKDVAPFFAAIGKPLVIQKITKDCHPSLQNAPTLIIRKDVFNTAQEPIIIGSHMIDVLRDLKERRILVDDMSMHSNN